MGERGREVGEGLEVRVGRADCTLTTPK